MSDNLTLEQEEVVHENPCVHFEIKNPIARKIFYVACFIAMISPVLLTHFLN